MSIQVLPEALAKADEAIAAKVSYQASELRRVADFIETHKIANSSVCVRDTTIVYVIEPSVFDSVMLGSQITLMPNRGGFYYDAIGERDGILINCYAYRSIPQPTIAPLLCICGEPEIAIKGDAS